MDNWYIVEREGRELAGRLGRTGKLPSAQSGRAVISELSALLLCSGRGSVTGERIVSFLEGAQVKRPLSEDELCSFITVLRAELLIQLAGLCSGLYELGDEDASDITGNIFTSIRYISEQDCGELIESVDRVDRILSRDSFYPLMEEETRRYYKHRLSRLAKKNGMSDREAAEHVIDLAEKNGRHVGYYILSEPMGRPAKRRKGGVYISLIVLMSLFFSILPGYVLDSPAVSLLLLLPISEIVKNLTDYVMLRLFRPAPMPRMSLEDGIPEEGRTLCAVSVLLTNPDSARTAAAKLEEYMLANRDCGENLLFSLLADLPEAAARAMPGDTDIIDCAKDCIEELNAGYGNRFFLFGRERSFDPINGRYMGWERKRGAITELLRCLRGLESGVKLWSGDADGLGGIRYIIALDSDTRLCAGSARELTGAAMHPLNRAETDDDRGCVKSGYGIIQPRISVDLGSANRSDFTRIFAGQGGLDPYGGLNSDIYQDLFGEGSFNGKGIIDIDAFLSCLDGRFPENRILSHDLLEGCYLRCGYMGECQLTDGYPSRVRSYYERMHRWVRGDWQISPWLGRRVGNAAGERTDNPLGELSKWKIFDNLRRSLVPVFTFIALLSGMFISGRAFLWAGITALLSIMSGMLISTAEMVFKNESGLKARYHSAIISGFAGWLMQSFIRLLLLPYEAWICLSACVTALYRMHISGKNMLEWVTAADSELKNKNGFWAMYLCMAVCWITGVIVLVLSPGVTADALGVLWILTPACACALSRERRTSVRIKDEDRRFLMNQCGSMWKYFEENMNKENNFLPPDNRQDQPAAGTAHRTSPTNIGLSLLVCMAAADLGIIGRDRAVSMISRTLTTVERLPKWNGHLYNWYDTRTLEVMEPKYVSTVDSGNLVGCLIALTEGLREYGEDQLAVRTEAIERA
ncbi:MAG: DUF3131 domain-containing protein, partial [Oscillospiraceae bacterium]|nr:DUF3131 domain-containing protein [Oscillospiraceae bacterium]